ncbi:MAG: SLBB domain-containing protein [Candidatus Latescibacterota bacterium]|nr:MAG: SLBB domain-containing protein [Candidatus Latescibacterota bacterium]
MKRTVILVIALTHLVGIVSPSLVAAQRSLSLEKRALSQQTSSPGEDAEEKASAPEIPAALSASLEGPIDPATYVLGPSDEVLLIVRGPKTTTYQLRVFPEGNIVLPNVGAFPAAGLTLVECKEGVRKELRRFYPTIEIDLQLTVPRRFVVFVVGEVTNPGGVELVAPARVGRAVLQAGGVTDGGSLRRIEILEDGKTIRKVDLYRFLRSGDFDQNPYLKEGQSVYVPPRAWKAAIVGEVRKPAQYEILSGETAADLVAFAEGFASTADSTRLLLERIQPGDEITTHTIEGDEAQTFELKDMDVVVVPDLVSYHMVEPVEVYGGGGRDGPFRIRENETLREFLLRLWRFSYRYEIEDAVIERYVGEDKPEFIEFSVPAVLAGDPIGDFVLKPGDLISFPTRERNVYVTGEVNVPGPIPFQPGITAERYIALAGGPNNIGTYDKIDIFGEDGEKRSGDRNSMIYRGETIVVKTRRTHQFGAIFSGLISITALAVAVIAVTKD